MAATSAPKEVVELVERFDRNRDSYLAGGINETQLRQEFINPFFSCLGWDIENKQGYAPAYREVIFEDSLRVGAETKAPDYCFRIGGMRKFFVETKKPAVNIATGVAPAFQLKRYAWTAKLPLSILTDFEEFAVYDCRARPFKTDKSSIGRIKFLEFKDYPARWPELYDTFSRDAVVKGSFDKFVEENRARKGTTEVDDAFLSDIERWRDLLARNIALRNPRLTTRELNFAVQRTIDRIIFLRICEDRLIEPYGQLQALLNGERVYPRLKEAFQRADDRYNSGIFHFRPEKNRPEAPDELSLKLSIDDKALKDIIANLYYPDSPYEFSVFPSEILGQVYEQFLGKVIRLTAGHQAKVEDKPEVRKAGGVYYTPTYIVDYIVKNTVGKLLEGSASPTPDPRPPTPAPRSSTPDPRSLTPAQASRLRILDPACGSGSFLLGAYQYLLNWHRDWYVKDGPEKHTKELFPAQGGDWRLTTAKKKEILLNNIYGVDIDQQAVEVTKLSLLLKVLEGENEQTIQSQLKLFQERALPDLGNNIKCGNSLIGPDFYQGEQQSLFDDEEQRIKVNAFDWQAEFPDIMKAGGFDAVIGNPPYVRMEELTEWKDYLRGYSVFSPRADLYAYFIEKETSLVRTGGRFGMIVSNKWMKAKYGGPLRQFVARNLRIHELIDFGELPVFLTASTFPCVVVATKTAAPSSAGSCRFRYAPIRELRPSEMESQIAALGYAVTEGPNHLSESWRLASQSVLTRLLTYPPGFVSLGTWLGHSVIGWGIKTGLNEAFVLSCGNAKAWLKATPGLAEIVKPLLVGDDIRRYDAVTPRQYLIYAGRGFDLERHAQIKKHLLGFRGPLGGRATVGSHPWYELQQPQPAYAKMFEHEKVVWPEIAKEPRFTLVAPGVYLNNKCFFTDCSSRFLLGVLNSRLAWELLKLMCSCLGDVNRGGRLELRQQYVARLPVPRNPAQDRHDKMVSLVERMLKLHKDLPKARTAPDKTAVARLIAATDKQIDQLAYELYGLTAEEIGIVEDGARRRTATR